MAIDYGVPTLGIVVDTNDPTQGGRVRVLCTSWGDDPNNDVHEGQWAQYVSPYGGTVSSMTRGPGIQQSKGGLTYGFWAIPKIGSQVIVMCLNKNPNHRIYIGCVFDPHSTNSLPHGRYMYDDHPALDKNGDVSAPFGPFTNSEGFLEPLNTNQKEAFTNYGSTNFEWQSRAADYAASAVDVTNINDSFSTVPDDKGVEHNGRKYTQGYQSSRTDPNSSASATHANYDNQTTCLVSPGFHAISMDDRQENCRMRMRTTSGHQIILDDTNERIYIATAKGNNWLEMDQDGNIDIFSNKKINVRSTDDINFTSDKSIKLYAKHNIHMRADKQIRMFAKENIYVKTVKDIIVKSQNLYMTILQDVDATITGNLLIKATDVHVNATNMFQTYTADLNIKSSNIFITATDSYDLAGGTVHLASTTDNFDIASAMQLQLKSTTDTKISATTNMQISGTILTNVTGGGATTRWTAGIMTYPATPPAVIAMPTTPIDATPATMPVLVDTLTAFATNRIPAHEPWARVMTKETIDEETNEKGDFTDEPEMAYDDSLVGKMERGINVIRGMFWRR